MQNRRWFMLAGVVAALFSLAILVAACGGDGDDGEGDGAKPTEPAATEPTATEPSDTEPAATEPADGAPTEATTIDASMAEFSFELASESAPAGSVAFDIVNNGTIPHDFWVIRTDEEPAALPVVEDEFIVDVDQLDVVDVVRALDVGQTAELAVDLDPGNYVIICNIPSHYQAGMYTSFTVE